MVRKLVLILSVVLFAVSFAAVAFASESAESTKALVVQF